MPRRSQEAEDEAYAQALQDEYRQESIRRQSGQNRRETNNRTTPSIDGDQSRDGDRATTRRSSSGTRKKKQKSGSKKKHSSSRKSHSHSRSSSRDSTNSGRSRDKQRRRRRRSKGEDEWLSAYHPEQQQHQQQEQQQMDSLYNIIPIPPPPFANSNGNDNDRADDQIPLEWGNLGDQTDHYSRIEQELADAEFAQRISESDRRQQELEEARIRTRSQTPGGSFGKPLPTTPLGFSSLYSLKDGNSSGGSTGPMTDDDEAIARRIQQELADAEYAQRINNLETDEAASRDVVLSLERQNQLNLAQHQQQQAPPKSCIAKWAPIVLCIAIAVTVPLLYIFDIFNPSDIPLLGDLFQDDWVGGTLSNVTFDDINGTLVPRLPADAFGWATSGKGLKLDILNACGDEWQPFVVKAIENWDNGSPIDSLSLDTTRIPYEYDCWKVDGKLKICNGDYGDNQWRGINEVRLMQGRQTSIISSTAKLNEYYLNSESDAQKLYTACHELGHGFGLPHWDDNFFNKDLGNCMDYTQNPHKNSEPDASNFLYLAQLYGGRDVSNNQLVSAEEAYVMANRVGETNPGKSQNNPGGRTRARTRSLFGIGDTQQQSSLRSSSDRFTGIPLSESRIQLDDADFDADVLHKPLSGSSRRILHADENAEIHVFESKEFPGQIVYQHYLLVRNDE